MFSRVGKPLPGFYFPVGLALTVVALAELLTEILLYPLGLAPKNWTLRLLLGVYHIRNIYPPGLIGQPPIRQPLFRKVLDVLLSLVATPLPLVEGLCNTVLRPFGRQAYGWTIRYCSWAQNFLHAMARRKEVR